MQQQTPLLMIYSRLCSTLLAQLAWMQARAGAQVPCDTAGQNELPPPLPVDDEDCASCVGNAMQRASTAAAIAEVEGVDASSIVGLASAGHGSQRGNERGVLTDTPADGQAEPAAAKGLIGSNVLLHGGEEATSCTQEERAAMPTSERGAAIK
jgi:hypothetical protein